MAAAEDGGAEKYRFIGKAIPRLEDRRFVCGLGKYAGDLAFENECHAFVVRSLYPHARILAVRPEPARLAPGVIAVLTGRDYLDDGHAGIPQMANVVDSLDVTKPAFDPARFVVCEVSYVPIASDRVRYAGEPVAIVLAESAALARDAAERFEIDYDALSAVFDAGDASAEGAQQLWDEIPDNVCLRGEFGDKAATDTAFARAASIVDGEFVHARLTPGYMEPRTVSGVYDATRGSYRIVEGNQGVGRERFTLAKALGVPPGNVEVICADVGGAFGTRTSLHPETVLVAWASRRTGRPVRWTADRSESFATDFQARDVSIRAALALDADGRILGLRETVRGNAGAYPASFATMQNIWRTSTTVYDVPAAAMDLLVSVTNTTPTTTYRGAGRPEATYVIERLLDIAARRLGVDRLELRRRNLISRNAFPYRSATGLTYDCGDFAGNMERAVVAAGWAAFEERRQTSAKAGFLRGIGLANYIETPNGAPSESVVVRVLAAGAVEIVTGTQSTGQGHETVYAQVAADLLEVPLDVIRIVTGDTRVGASGGGTHSNRSMRLVGTLLVSACADVVDQVRAISGATDVLRTVKDRGEAIESKREFTGRIAAFPTGCAICEVEIDRSTGAASVVAYTQIDDVGQPINPAIVHGQTHGGIAQGIGEALAECVVFDAASGSAANLSFMGYAMPRAPGIPSLNVELVEDPTAGNPLRVKGAGEGGVTPALAAIGNALVDALRAYGIEHVAMPATAPHIWQLINASSIGCRAGA